MVQVYSRISSDFYILPPRHWTRLFVCHFNSTGSIQSCSHFGALNLSYTLPSLSYQLLILTWVKWSIWGWSALPKDTTLKQCPKIERYFREKHDISLLNQTGFDTARQAATSARHCAMSASTYSVYILTLSLVAQQWIKAPSINLINYSLIHPII